LVLAINYYSHAIMEGRAHRTPGQKIKQNFGSKAFRKEATGKASALTRG
jgi:hypothetical protein